MYMYVLHLYVAGAVNIKYISSREWHSMPFLSVMFKNALAVNMLRNRIMKIM